MKVRVLKNFKWMRRDRIFTYVIGDIVETSACDAESMIKHGYAESYNAEAKMLNHDYIDDKMMRFEIENKVDKVTNRRSKKSKEVDNE